MLLSLLMQEPRFYKFQLCTAYKNFPLPWIVGLQNCKPRCCSTPRSPACTYRSEYQM